MYLGDRIVEAICTRSLASTTPSPAVLVESLNSKHTHNRHEKGLSLTGMLASLAAEELRKYSYNRG